MAVDGRIVVDQSIDDAERVWSSAVETHFAERVA
jgi:hypothetical protein